MVQIAGFAIGPTGESIKVEYRNEGERNVHIWGLVDRARDVCQGDGLDTPNENISRDLIAGFYNHDNRVNFATLYKWLGLLIEPPREYDEHPDPHTRPNFGLAKLMDVLGVEDSEIDPREARGLFPRHRALEEDVERCLISTWIPRNDDRPCTPGHYVIFNGYFSFKGNTVETLETLLKEEPTPLVEESIFGSINWKMPRVDRDANFRTAIRERDEACVITGTRPLYRKRGIDYAGLEAAHLFPVAWVQKANQYLYNNKRLVYHFVNKNHGAQRSRNGILLRVDIHRLFDRYVWSIFEGQIYLFEKAKPDAMDASRCFEKTFEQWRFLQDHVGLNDHSGIVETEDDDDPYTPPGTVLKEPPESALMRFHFECALHKNIVGFGWKKGE